MKIALAEALLKRRELQDKLEVLRQVDQKALYEVKAKRVKVTEDLDDVVASVPKLKPEEVTKTFDWYARQLRMVDAVIQRANWETVVEVPDESMGGYVE